MEQLVNFFITPAFAEAGDPGAAQGSMSFVIMFVIFFLFIYFAIWRPQNKRAREQQDMMDSLAKGDEVMTAGGLLGKISQMADQYVTLAVADNVELVMQKSSIVTILPKGTLKSIK